MDDITRVEMAESVFRQMNGYHQCSFCWRFFQQVWFIAETKSNVCSSCYNVICRSHLHQAVGM